MSFGYQVLGFGSGGVDVTYLVASGGTETTCGDYKIHTFTGPGTFCVSENCCAMAVDYMVIAGGGGSGHYYGGGGGAGGYRESSGACSGSYAIAPRNSCVAALAAPVQGYPITIGGGGSAGIRPGANQGGLGTSTVFSSITSGGGGGGGGAYPPGIAGPGMAGASGGGGGGLPASPGGTGNTPPTSPVQGHDGATNTAPGQGGGGGGAAAAACAPSPSVATGGDGVGAGINPSTCVGTPGPCGSVRYFGGGGGGPVGPGGVGGGGPGNGTANTGGGAMSDKKTGGSGIVIIRYQYQ
jgi:hypothetical protein